jgi:hypothetical protein
VKDSHRDGEAEETDSRLMKSRRSLLFVVCTFLSTMLSHAGWVPVDALEAPVAAEGNYFGMDLLMEGSTLIAGESGADAGNNSRVGAVVSFERNGTGAWQRTQHLTYPGEPAQSGIGREIALSGNTLLVSAITPAAGRVMVYNRSAPGAQWVLAQTLNGDTQTEYFGNSVALDGDNAVVGADNANAAGLNARGAVYVFTRSGGTWTRSQRIPAPPEATDWARFGSGVALRGDWLAVNARNDGPYRGGIRGTAGSTYLYRRSGGTWTLHRKLVPDPEIAQETGWECTALRDDTLVIGAHRGTNPVTPFTYSGAAYVYTLNAVAGTWSATPQKLSVASLADFAGFGRDVSVEGNRMAISASSADGHGKVFTYTRGAGGVWAEDGGFSHHEIAAQGQFGARVVLHQGRIAATAATISTAGKVYLFSEGGALQAVTGGTYALGATNASLLGIVLNDGAAVPVSFEYGLTPAYGNTLPANPGTVQTTGTAQQVTLSIGLLLPQTTYHYRVRAGTATGEDKTFTTGPFDAALADAVDAPQLQWDSYGTYGGWSRQTTTTSDGSDAARSAAIPHGQFTSLQTLITGPGALSFRWKVSSQSNRDYLLLYVNGALQANITGETAWEQVSFDIPAGRYLFSWIYNKDAAGVSGSDCGWVDTLVWTPASGTAAWNAWRTAQFTAAQLNDSAVSGPGADPERDGLTNLEEAFFGTAPLAANSGRLSPARYGDALHLSWEEPLNGNGVTAAPEWSPDGQTWLLSGQSAPGISARNIVVTLTGTGASAYVFTARLDTAGLPRALVRLRCSVAP